ncbi:hypothetical protein ACAG26_03770 [Mycobacterium sp. pUA109]|uniref:hypothetical protein n=1 Tax=Mycobacterium sp. pUA109 TaxID=3238982 RepID=UPI00351B233F
MTGPHFDTEDPGTGGTRPISVAELLAKNGTIGSPPVTGRRRRRRGNSDAVTVAELTGEIPVIDGEDDEDHPPDDQPDPGPQPRPQRPNGTARLDDAPPPRPPREVERRPEPVTWSEPGPRWPSSPPQPRRGPGPERSAYPRPIRRGEAYGRPGVESGAEQMSPDPVDNYADMEVDVMDTDVRDAELPTDDSAYVRSYLGSARNFFGKRRGGHDVDDDLADLDEDLGDEDLVDLDEDHDDIEDDLVDDVADAHPLTRREEVLRGGWVVLQSILAVAFGAGLFLAFDQLWQWNKIVALVLSVLVTLGLVAAVQVVRKTVDTTSTLIAVAVGLLITLGPLALLRSG